jgi:hypothetical protein
MNRRLAEVVISTLRESDPNIHRERLAQFDHRAWKDLYRWLDASGLAIYFLQRLSALGLEEAIPGQVLDRLKQNATDNRHKTAQMLEEFVRINRQFQKAGLSYANLKGFTLVPAACPDATLRCQFDLDFLIDRDDIHRCQTALGELDYTLVATGANVQEFKAGGDQLPSVRDLYKPKPQRSVEVHLSECVDKTRHRTDPLDRRCLTTIDGSEYPVLADCDKFVGLALHLFKHLNAEWTRTSWIFEFGNLIDFHAANQSLWQDIERQVANDPQLKIAIGTSTLMAERVFGTHLPGTLTTLVHALPSAVRLWVERYRDDVIFAEFPGTKLYLLLQEAIAKGNAAGIRNRREKLLPLHLPSRVIVSSGSESPADKLSQIVSSVSYFLFRLRFHISQGLTYLVEVSRWKRNLASLQG